MYNPSQCTDTACEWLELYNAGSTSVDLTNYKINGANFDDMTLQPKKFIVVARKLLGNPDEESFEHFWGNGDGIWNEQDSFLAVDGSFSLSNDGASINFSNGMDTDIFSYTSSIGGNGNGKTVIRQNLTKDSLIIEGQLDGTAGRGESTASNTSGTLATSVQIINIAPEILSLDFPDESSEEGYQLFPEDNKTIHIEATAKDSNGLLDQLTAKGAIKTTDNELIQEFAFTKTQNNSVTTFTKDIQLALQSGDYIFEVTVQDQNNGTTTKAITFTYLDMLSIKFDKDSIDFGSSKPGESTQNNLKVLNNGNVEVDFEISGSDLQGDQQQIPVDNIKRIIGNTEAFLSSIPEIVDVNLISGSSIDVDLVLNAPEVISGFYQGDITILAVRSE